MGAFAVFGVFIVFIGVLVVPSSSTDRSSWDVLSDDARKQAQTCCRACRAIGTWVEGEAQNKNAAASRLLVASICGLAMMIRS